MEERNVPFISKLILKQLNFNTHENKKPKFKVLTGECRSNELLKKMQKAQSLESSKKWTKIDVLTQKQQKNKNIRNSLNSNMSVKKIDTKKMNNFYEKKQDIQKLKRQNQLYSLILNKKKNMDRMKLNIIIRQALNDLMQRRQKLLNPLEQNQLSHSFNF